MNNHERFCYCQSQSVRSLNNFMQLLKWRKDELLRTVSKERAVHEFMFAIQANMHLFQMIHPSLQK